MNRLSDPTGIITLVLIFSLASISISACERDATMPSNEPKPIALSAEQQLLVENSKGFAFDLLREVCDNADETENVFISPLSVSLALAMTYNGAGGTTRDAMHHTMQLPDLTPDQINKAWRQLMKDLGSVDPKVIMNIANSIWYREGFHVEPPFIAANETHYDAEVRELDFGRPDAKEIINAWVAEKTNQLIDKIVEEISNQTVMILLNAIYFNGQWKYEFDPAETASLPFTLGDGTSVNLPVMQQISSYNYFKHELFSVAELPYGRGNYSMLVFLPTPGTPVGALIDAMDDDLWNDVRNRLSAPRKLNLRLPKFKFAFEQQLNKALEHMGMGIAFSPSDANFSGINPLEQLFISEVMHKAFVEVNEEGTEAAAVTSVVIERTSAEQPETFHVDRPFLFFITEKYTHAVIFSGRVMEPVL